MSDDHDFQTLETFLAKLPGVNPPFGHGEAPKGPWWVKLSIDLDNPLAWHVIQELAHVLNYLSVSERLPTVFKPVSPPPYLNGGPREFLSWVIECTDDEWRPDRIATWLEGRLPQPVEDLDQWTTNE